MARAPRYNPKTGVLIPAPNPYASPHLLYLLHGKLPGGETWSCGLRTEAMVGAGPDLQVLADYIARNFAAANNLADSFRTYNAPGQTFEGVTIRSVDIHGVTTAQAEGVLAQPGQAGAQTAPDQTAIVISLHTARAGRTGKGRVYMPITAPVFNGTTGKISATMQTGLQNAWDQFLEGCLNFRVGDAGPTPDRLFAICVQSRVSGAAGAPVRQSLVGDALDTQRGRRRKLRETYTVTAAPYTPPLSP